MIMGFLKSISLAVFVGMLALVAVSDSQCTTSAGHFNCREFINLTCPFCKKSAHQATCSPGDFELLQCDRETELLSIIIKNQTFTLKNISLEKNTMSLSLPIKNPCAYPETPRYVNMRLPYNFTSTSVINVFFGPDPGNDLLEFRKFQCGSDDWVYWGSNDQYTTPSHIVDSCKIHFVLMNDRTLDVIRSSTQTQEFWEKLLTALRNEFEVSIRMLLPPSQPSPPPLQPSATKDGGRAEHLVKRPTFVIVVSTLSSVALLIGICIIIIFKRRKVKLGVGGKGIHIFLSSDGHDITSFESLQFDFETIRVATDNFKSDNKLGQGGFGSVYKGKLIEGNEIAVKRLAYRSGQGDHEFTNEVVILSKLQHRNLVRLLGYCLEGNERLLIYEFVPNSSLDHFLFDALKRVHLDWETRYKIISGIAKGLLYLHEDSRLRIIHRDLKAGNILLDEEMCPKIADFGMARLFILHQTQGDTTRIVGTYGYMAPEYAMHGKFSVKSDVYSFGVLLLEIISGHKNSRFCIDDMPQGLPSFAWENWKAGKAQNIIDPTILNGHIINDILRCIHIGLLCVQDSVSARPTMAMVALMLNSASQYLPLPSKPAYLSSIEPEMTIKEREGGEVAMFTVNQVSFSNLLPR